MASTSQEGERSPLLVTLLSSGWRSSSDRDLSTLIRELAIQLAKHPSVQVSVFLPQCSEDDKNIAAIDKVQLIEAEELTGFDSVDWLINIPDDHAMDCIIGHGVHLGRQIQCIRRNHKCRWIQIVHTAPEELAVHKSNIDAIPKGEKMQQTEIKLCELADQVVAVGPKLADTYRRFLHSREKHQDVIDLTPSIFTEFKDLEQPTEGRRTFCVLVIGSGGSEDFNLKGYDLVAEAIAQLKEKSYQLKFLCAPQEKEHETAKKLLEHGIDRSQLIVRRFNENRETLARLFCEVDLAIMPSRCEGFGLTALEALSAGLPVLVSSNSGLGQALMKVPLGPNCLVDSEDPNDWASKIKAVRDKNREVRLAESKLLREKYVEKYSWQEPCGVLVEKMRNLVTALKLRIDVESMKRAEQSTQDRSASSKKPGGPQNGEQLEASTESVPSGHTEPSNIEAEAPQSPPHTSTKEQVQGVLCLFADKYLKNTPPKSKDEYVEFLARLRELRVIITGHCVGSLLITVKCDSLQVLERFWEDYLSGHLGEVVQRSFVTEKLLVELSLAELKLKTTISEEEYEACKKYLKEYPARGPVCVISIAGPYRSRKSYILNEAFGQTDVFRPGHWLDPETIGIWMWVVPQKIQDSNGQEFTVVLLDSECIHAVRGEGLDDDQIFTLTVLLASVLIYNSAGVPTRHDLDKLDFIAKLSQRVNVRTSNGGGSMRGQQEDTEFFHKTFPVFIWLLRDVMLAIPPDCKDIKEYLLTKVFRDQDLSTAPGRQGQKVAESILRFFPVFHAFTLPPPSVDIEVIRSLHENKALLESQFLNGLEQFKSLLRSTLVPKHSYTNGEFVTGEGIRVYTIDQELITMDINS